MNIGRMDKRVRVERPVAPAARNAVGEPVAEWEVVAERWAAVEPLTGRELFASDKFHGEVTARIRLRHLDGVTTGWRVVCGETIYDVVASIDPRMRGEQLELLCKAGVSGG